MQTIRYCLALDLKNDHQLIATYKRYHEKIWPEITNSIRDAGIHSMEIYHVMDRLFMIIEADSHFSFEKKANMDRANPKVQDWEELMDQYQKRLPNTPSNTKWVLMEKIFDLDING